MTVSELKFVCVCVRACACMHACAYVCVLDGLCHNEALTHVSFMIITHTLGFELKHMQVLCMLKCVSARSTTVHVLGSLAHVFMLVPVLTADERKTGLGLVGATQFFVFLHSCRSASQTPNTRLMFGLIWNLFVCQRIIFYYVTS